MNADANEIWRKYFTRICSEDKRSFQIKSLSIIAFVVHVNTNVSINVESFFVLHQCEILCGRIHYVNWCIHIVNVFLWLSIWSAIINIAPDALTYKIYTISSMYVAQSMMKWIRVKLKWLTVIFDYKLSFIFLDVHFYEWGFDRR